MTALEALNLAAPLADAYNAVERKLLVAIARQLTLNDNHELNEVSKWQIKKLAQLGQLDKDAAKIIAAGTKGVPADFADTVQKAIEATLAEDGLTDMWHNRGFSESAKKAVGHYRAQAKDVYNQVNTVMKYKAHSSYVKAVNSVADKMTAEMRIQQAEIADKQSFLDIMNSNAAAAASGSVTRTRAVRDTIHEMAQRGIPAFVDRAGREWSPEAYVNMDVRNTVKNTATAAAFGTMDALGQDVFEVSSHAGARPKCRPWQGKLISKSGRTTEITDLRGNKHKVYPLSATSYGEPDGLFGINCGHRPRGVSDGLFVKSLKTSEEYGEADEELYNKICRQRELERRVRKSRTEAEMLEAAGDTEGAKAVRRRAAEQNKQLRAYCDQNGLKYRDERVKTYGTTRTQSGTSPCSNGHNFVVFDEKPASCTAEGYRKSTCTVCGKTRTETLPALGHTYKDTVVAPTCTDKGYTLHKCEKCGHSFTDNETKALGHAYKAIKTVLPTCVDKGFIKYECTRCGDTYSDEIAATGHTFGKYKIVTKPTSVSTGLKIRVCAKCGEKDEVIIPKTKTVTKAEKKQALENDISALQSDLDNLAQKEYNGIWKYPVTAADYPAKKSAIQAKKDYFNQQLQANPADAAKWQSYLNAVDDFALQGAKYEKLLAEQQNKQNALALLLPKKKASSGKFSSDAYTAARKNAAMWAKTRPSADNKLRATCGTVWQGATHDERSAAYKYTAGSGSFNRPLRGYNGSWSSFAGVGKVDLNNEGSGQAIKELTGLIDRSTYSFDIWLNRGCDDSGSAAFFKVQLNKWVNYSQKELEQCLLGKTFTDEAFMSTSPVKGSGFGGAVIYNVYAPAGTKMLYCEPFSQYGHGTKSPNWDGVSKQSSFGSEFEMLIQRGTEYRVTKVERKGGKTYVDMEVVNQI